MKTRSSSSLLLAALLPLTLQAQEPTPAAPDVPVPPPATAAAEAAPEAAPLAPKIVCAESLYDFGEKNNTEIVEHDYPIRNEGTLSLEIRDVHASCGCTAAKPSQSVIPPGAEASIHIRLDLRGRTGLQQKTITVQSNDPNTPTLTLQLKGTAVQILRAQPSNLFFGRIEPGAARNRTFDIISSRGPFQIVSTRADNPGLVVTPLALEPGADGSTRHFELKIDDSLPEGNVSGTVFIKTDMADQPELAIPAAAYVVAPPAPAPETAPAPEPPPVPAP